MPASFSALLSFLRELERRRVYRTAALYGAAAFVTLQAADLLISGLGLPSWILTLLIVLTLLGFPAALVLAWTFDLSPPGIHRDRGGEEPAPLAASHARLVFAAVLLLALGGAGFAAFTRLDVGVPPGDRAIAVLPFLNLTGGAENEYFSDGITEDVLTQLAKIAELRVISRTSVMLYKNSGKSLPEIGSELSAGYVLEGSVRRAGDRLRIVAQLIDVRTDEHLWAERYDRSMSDLFEVQADIAENIARALRVRLSGEERDRLAAVPTDSATAYDLFLQARDYSYRYDKEANEVAIALARRALAIDPALAPAYALLGTAYAYKVRVGDGPEWGDSAMVAAQRAITLDSDLADGHRALGNALLRLGRYPEALRSYERAVALNPSDWRTAMNMGVVHGYRGESVEAIRRTRHALTVDPKSPQIGIVYQNLASYYLDLSLLDRAEQALEHASNVQSHDHPQVLMLAIGIALCRRDLGRAVQLGEALAAAVPTDASAQLVAGDAHLFAGNEDRARLFYERAYTLSPDGEGIRHYAPVLLGYVLWRAGERSRAQQLFREYREMATQEVAEGSQNYTLFFSLAAVSAIQGERGAALQWLSRAIDAGGVSLEWALRNDPLVADLRGLAAFQLMVRNLSVQGDSARRRVLQDEL